MQHINLNEEFKKRGDWITQFTIDGGTYGGAFDAASDWRVERFFQLFPHARRILELGSLEGGHTLRLAQHPSVQQVVGVEGRPANVAKAQFIKELLGNQKMIFIESNLETTNLREYGIFDAVFCCGVLYHLPQPWELLSEIARVSPNLFLSTHYASEDDATTERQGYRGKLYQEFGLVDPLSGLSPDSFWPTLQDLMNMLRQAEFHRVQVVENNIQHPNGPIITLAATRTGRLTQLAQNFKRYLRRV